MKLYNVVYWNERAMEWRGTGTNNLPLEEAQVRKSAMRKQCHDCVRFTIQEALVAG